MTIHSLACVSFLNSKPLIEPLLNRPDVQLHLAVPSRLLPLVESGQATAGLLSIVDFQTSACDLLLVPAGAIACDGSTLTVRIFSKVPPEKIRTLHADTDSHTSVILAQLILRRAYSAAPAIIPLAAQSEPDSLLLIGDKVVNAAPNARIYPHQLDLGEEWKKLTGLPFVFACWMIREDVPPAAARELAGILAAAQRQGATMTEALLDTYAAEKHWPRDLARRYFTEYLRYTVTPEGRTGIARFFDLAGSEGLLTKKREPRYLDPEK